MDSTLAISELRVCLQAAVSAALAMAPAACESVQRPGCPLTRAARYVCFPAPMGTTTPDDGATSSGSDAATEAMTSAEATSTTEATTTAATTIETSDGAACVDYAAGPPNVDPDATWSGPIEDGASCCFWIEDPEVEDEPIETDGSVCGRPFLVDGRARLAPGVSRPDWLLAQRPTLAGLNAATRRELAAAWSSDAAAEHASVAAFARFALQSMAVGAPADLVADTHRAMRDEIEHARLCYGLASAYAGRSIGPGPLAIDGALPARMDLAAIVTNVVVEGCLGETFAAVQARVAAAEARDPVVRAVLERIAADEARHAALAWRFAAWALARPDRRVRAAFLDALERVAPSPSRMSALDLRIHGRPSHRAIAELQLRARAELVLPLARALLDARRSEDVAVTAGLLT